MMNTKRYYYITDQDYAIAEANGIKKATLDSRVKVSGWDIQTAITKPVTLRKTGNWSKWKDKSIVCYNTFAARIRGGMDPEEAATTPFIPHKKRHNNNSVFSEEEFELAESKGIKRSTVLQRYNACGWAKEDCLNIPMLSKSEAAKVAIASKKGHFNLRELFQEKEITT